MNTKSLNLNKLLKLFELNESQLTSALRSELRSERRKSLELDDEGGGDFHVPFWSDAKLHMMGLLDLVSQVDVRIGASKQRKRLYPLLARGFLSWLDALSRGTNRKIGLELVTAHNRLNFDDIGLILKVDNLLCVKLGENQFRLVYPYFSEKPVLSAKWARVGLWAMTETLEKYSVTDIEILDVLRGRSYSGLSVSLKGDEQALFVAKFKAIKLKWDELRPEYGL